MAQDKPQDETLDVGHAPITATLQQLDKGAVVDKATRALAELVEAVHTTVKKGTVTLKITVAPLAKNDADRLAVTCDVASKLPAAAARASIFFPDDAGNLLRDDPNQPVLDGLKLAPEPERAANKL